MADAGRIYNTRVGGGIVKKRRAETWDDDTTPQTRNLPVAPLSKHHACCVPPSADYPCDPSNTSLETHANPYQRKPRRKTREDRYEPKAKSEKGKNAVVREVPRKMKILRKRNGNSRIGERFCASNVRQGRLTTNFHENLGIFKKGKTSAPIHCRNVPYLNFSETDFLANEPQILQGSGRSTREIDEQKKRSEDEAVACRFERPLIMPHQSTNKYAQEYQLSNRGKEESSDTEKRSFPVVENMTDTIRPEPHYVETRLRDRSMPTMDMNSSEFREQSFDSSIEEQLYESLRSCNQLTIPYEEYKPVVSSGFLHTLEDLRKLCVMRERSWARMAGNFAKDYKVNTPEGSFGARNKFSQASAHGAQPPVPGPVGSVSSSADVKEALLEFLLDTEDRFTEEVAFRILEDVIDADQSDAKNTSLCSAETSTNISQSGENDFDKSLYPTSFRSTDIYRPLRLSHIKASTLTNNSTVNQVGSGRCSALENVESLDRNMPTRNNESLPSFALGRQPDREPMPCWVTNRPLSLISQNATFHGIEIRNSPQRGFWRRNKLY